MIVWLASYPRSGNTLLRTVLYQTMGLESVSDEVGEKMILGMTEAARSDIGIAELSCDWDEFYRSATQSKEVFLVKTHRPPHDDQAAIYIVRDGRMASLSYSRFHQRFTPKPYPTLLELILGGDYYGGWADHCHVWMERANTLMVRFEDLVDGHKHLLEALAETVKFFGQITPWQNPFDQLHHMNPDFFQRGEVTWQDDPAWTPMVNAVFFYLHGDMMVNLGYSSQGSVAEAMREVPWEWFELVNTSRRFLTAKNALEQTCGERQAVINSLKLSCDERLALIEKLTKSGM